MVVTLKNAIFWDVMPCGSCRLLHEPHSVTLQKMVFISLFLINFLNIVQKCTIIYFTVTSFLYFSAKHGFLRCVYAASRYKCRKEEALFLKKIAETLSDTRVYSPHCSNVDTQLCSHGTIQKAPILMTLLTATFFSLFNYILSCCWEVITHICMNQVHWQKQRLSCGTGMLEA
jgi:hypothetical protein